MKTVKKFEDVKNNNKESLDLNLIITSDNKYAVSDYNVYDWLQNIIDNQVKDVYCATNAQFNAIRIAVKAELIEPFSFVFNNDTIQILSTGKLDCFPSGLFDTSLHQLVLLRRN